MKEDFYIGWQEKAPGSHAQKTKFFVWTLMLIIPILVIIFVTGQKSFRASVFEIGKLTTVSGILVKSPIPCLRIFQGYREAGRPEFKRLLLIGFGKFGADPTIKAIEKEVGKDLEGKNVQLEGKLIYYAGMMAMELTNGKEAYKGLFASDSLQAVLTYEPHSETTFSGEILDPKCYLGVMRPGEGKAHRSCAIRCLSGGLPALFRSDNAEHLFLLDANGQPLPNTFAPYVADQIRFCASWERWDDWLVAKVDLAKGFYRLKPYWMKKQVPAMCSGQ